MPLAVTGSLQALETLRHFVGHLEEGVYVTSAEGDLLDANPALLGIFGVTSLEALRPYRVQDLWVDPARRVEEMAILEREGHVRGFEVQLRRPGGDVRTVLDSCFATADASGRTLCFGILVDVTERRRAEQRLSLQSTAMEAVANAICITDAGGRIEWVNPAFTRLTGYGEGDAVGQHTRILRSGVMPPSLYADLWRTVQSGRVWHGELVNRRRDGTLYDEAMTITPVPGPDGAAGHFVAIKEDVTERHRLEERLRDAQRLEAVGRLAGGVAHDFNNLLQAMLGISDLLRSGELAPAEQGEQLDELEELFHRGGQLTRQLLLFSRREEPKVEACDLNTVVRDTAKLLRRLLRENVELRMELANEPLELVADRGQLGQVWMNLAVNAADAMPEGGALTVRSGRADEAHVWFSVEDTGHGIADEVRAHIFEPFYTTKRDHRGTGLGLSVVHGIVSGHGGRVEVASEVGRGSAFRVVLPSRGTAAGAAARGGVEARRVPRGKGERVLLVEDNESVRRTFQRLLSGLGYQVSAMESAEEAEALRPIAPFELLLTDVLLPGASGGELARRLRARWPGLAVVFMSGYAEDELIRGDVASGGAMYLQKPVDIEVLGSAVRGALDAPR